jgi:hypothetical protein
MGDRVEEESLLGSLDAVVGGFDRGLIRRVLGGLGKAGSHQRWRRRCSCRRRGVGGEDDLAVGRPADPLQT